MNNLSKQFLCHNCVSDKYLKSFILKNGETKLCCFCKNKRKSINLEYLANWIDNIFQDNYRSVPIQEIINNPQNIKSISGLNPETIIGEIFLGCNKKISSQIYQYLKNKRTNSSCQNPIDYNLTLKELPINSDQYSKLWLEFREKIIKSERYFYSQGKEKLDKLFQFLLSYCSDENIEILKEIESNENLSTIYRARYASNNDILEKILNNPIKQLGHPELCNTRNGRMNPIGISFFYGAYCEKTCVSEIRPPVGGIVVLGTFEITSQCTLLDLTEIKSNYPSMFDPKFLEKIIDIKFVEKFTNEISKPILPEDENLEYIPTQAVTEFISNHLEQKIDGIIYPSIQTDRVGKNIVIFNPLIIENEFNYKKNKSTILKLIKVKKVKIYYSEPKFTEYF